MTKSHLTGYLVVTTLLLFTSNSLWAGKTDLQVSTPQPTLSLVDLIGHQEPAQSPTNLQSSQYSEEYRPTLGDRIILSGIHRIMGYVAIGTTLAAATTAIVAPEIHPPFGWAALGTSLGASVLGAIGYWDFRAEIWPHFLFMGLAEIGLAMNAFGVFEPGSTAHRITGISSVVSMAVGYLAIRLIF
jgi:hypothetical protein